ncbi:ubiquinol-cytochrome c reductase core subunit 2 [Geosmithia morbida]|uniref:Cytochrome b-c1 complex subunit 2, mitochondrial n=1 Tax=Geosmithia morbida TaxID=1094350 RepID=A0A9P4YW50_9HYPO|nr:ubiquinol-cytochrome c reductase core subunit 2 [Geosmithia morbida]KAF4123627.1 ubiquinol-cytochrome c reductase core subunit 2 [Geosmithia morbida]
MLSRSSLARNAHQAARRSLAARSTQQRTFAAAASSGAFETSDISGLKVASRDTQGPATKLALVSKAGTRYQPLPGLTVGLSEFAFKNTQRRSALRITRESELLGGRLSSSHTRESLVLEANFLRADLPYFAELLAEVVSMTKYTTHEFHEEIESVLRVKQGIFYSDAAAVALDNVHAVAFHGGLGNSVYPNPSSADKKYMNEEYIASFSDAVYTKPNIALIADGAVPEDLAKWVPQFFKDVQVESQSGQKFESQASKYHGGEQRLSHASGNSIVIAFPGSAYTGPKPEVSVLAQLLGGQSTIKWSPGYSLLGKATADIPGLSASASNLAYSDAGLLAIQLTGSAASVRKGAEAAVKALESVANGTVANEDVAKAVANAKFSAFDGEPSLDLVGSGLISTGKAFESAALIKGIEAVNADKLKAVAKALLESKASVSTVGDLFVLPYAEQLGLRV